MSPLAHGSNEISDLYVGSNPVQKIYRGNQQVWPAVPPLPPGEASFSMYANWSTRAGRIVQDGDVIEGVAPLGLQVHLDSFIGFATDDPRDLYCEVDYGERYVFQSLTNPTIIPSEARFIRGTSAGLYPGFISGHSCRGYDMAGNLQLTSGNPVVDLTITAYVTDGVVAVTRTFTVRLHHYTTYYQDRTANSIAPGSTESARAGIVCFSRDGDFTGAPTGPRVYYHTLADGNFSRFTWTGDKTANGGPNYGWGGNSVDTICVLFKAGQTFYPAGDAAGMINHNQTLTTWYHAGPGGTQPATIDCRKNSSYERGQGFAGTTGYGIEGMRIYDLSVIASDYDPTDSAQRQWWNELRYTDKVGVIEVNTRGNQNANDATMNGAILTDSTGAQCQVIGDTGTTLLTTAILDAEGNQTTFSDGATLTGPNGSVRFVASGSRQGSVPKKPSGPIGGLGGFRLLVDRVSIAGPQTGIAFWHGVISDVTITNYFDYGLSLFNDIADVSISGTVVSQPFGFISEPIDVGGSISPNRSIFNTINAQIPDQPVENRIRHAAVRVARLGLYSEHFCFVYGTGGHGALHQPLHRLGTGGNAVGEMYACFAGNCFSGGIVPLSWGHAQTTAIPRTPKAVLITDNHFIGSPMGVALLGTNRTNTTVQNNLFEYPSSIPMSTSGSSVSFISFNDHRSGMPYTEDPDINPLPPVVRYNTFVWTADGAESATLGPLDDDIRGITVLNYNNAFAIDESKWNALDPSIAALNDDPGTHYTAEYIPLPTAKAYQSATGFVTYKDGIGNVRGANPSQGYREP
jgi:hypothetical protein